MASEGRRAYYKEWYANGGKEKIRKSDAVWKAQHREQALNSSRRAHYKHRYGISLECYQEMAEAQQGCCAICGRLPNERLHLDHDHKTGKIRQLLCRWCNTVLGRLEMTPGMLESTSEYLVKHG
jgi:hypothetical protein